MKNLYAPWREHYTLDQAHQSNDGQPKDDCPFCVQLAAHQDDKYYILKRFEYHAVILNLYPYNAGHLLVITNKHVAQLSELSAPTRAELMEITAQCSEILKTAINAQGINIGLNMGKAAGAGIPSHLHMHVLPRFNGDTNFMPTLMHTKVISFDLREMYATLKKHF